MLHHSHCEGVFPALQPARIWSGVAYVHHFLDFCCMPPRRVWFRALDRHPSCSRIQPVSDPCLLQCSYLLVFHGSKPSNRLCSISLILGRKGWLGRAKLDVEFQMPPYKCWAVGSNHFPQPHWLCFSANTVQYAVSLHCYKDACCWLMFYLGDPADLMLVSSSETVASLLQMEKLILCTCRENTLPNDLSLTRFLNP